MSKFRKRNVTIAVLFLYYTSTLCAERFVEIDVMLSKKKRKRRLELLKMKRKIKLIQALDIELCLRETLEALLREAEQNLDQFINVLTIRPDQVDLTEQKLGSGAYAG